MVLNIIDKILIFLLIILFIILGCGNPVYFGVLVVFAFVCFLSVCVRLFFLNIIKTISNALVDLVDHIKYKRWRECKESNLICYTGLFGRGKTLSAVHKCVSMYNTYDGKKVYDKERKKWVTQKVICISNVELKSIPYERLESLSQIVAFAERQKEKDIENDTLTLCTVLIDEASVQLNSRNFKSNIDANFLNTLLTCRHYHIVGIYLTSQRFNLCDKLLRDVCQTVCDCRKVWRFQVIYSYNAWEMENATNPTLINPIRRSGWFVRNSDYAAYDTLATVDNLKKSCESGDMLSEEEILALRSPGCSDMDSIANTSRTYRKKKKTENRKFL